MFLFLIVLWRRRPALEAYRIKVDINIVTDNLQPSVLHLHHSILSTEQP